MDRTLKRYTVGEEVFNSVTHGIGSLLSIAGMVILIVMSVANGSKLGLASSLIFGISLIMLYTMSTLYHAIAKEGAKEVLRVFDHTSIFFLIAGTYTPICLIALDGNTKGLWVVAAVWFCAIVGIVLNAVSLAKTEKFSMVLYLIMGWAVVAVFKDVIAVLPTAAFWLLLSGGICYTGGIIFYAMKNIKYMHGIWHIFVLAGSILHYLCIAFYILPMSYA